MAAPRFLTDKEIEASYKYESDYRERQETNKSSYLRFQEDEESDSDNPDIPRGVLGQMRVVQREKTNDEMFDELNSRAESSRLSEEQKRKEEVDAYLEKKRQKKEEKKAKKEEKKFKKKEKKWKKEEQKAIEEGKAPPPPPKTKEEKRKEKEELARKPAADRDEWMSVMDNDAFKLYGNEKEEVKKIERPDPDAPAPVSSRELNPVMSQTKEAAAPFEFAETGNFRERALKRIIQNAEEEGLDVDEVIRERFGEDASISAIKEQFRSLKAQKPTVENQHVAAAPRSVRGSRPRYEDRRGDRRDDRRDDRRSDRRDDRRDDRRSDRRDDRRDERRSDRRDERRDERRPGRRATRYEDESKVGQKDEFGRSTESRRSERDSHRGSRRERRRSRSPRGNTTRTRGYEADEDFDWQEVEAKDKEERAADSSDDEETKPRSSLHFGEKRTRVDAEREQQMDEEIDMRKEIVKPMNTGPDTTKCYQCTDSDVFRREGMVAWATRTYLHIPARGRLVDGHCRISWMDHEPQSIELDDDTRTEIRNFKKCVQQMFHTKLDKEVVFIETCTERKIKKVQHGFIDCFPMPRKKDAQLYFLQMLQHADEEWSDHKKVIETTKERPLFNAIAKGFPYFHVSFGVNRIGYAHVIEDADQFSHDAGMQMMMGLYELEDGNANLRIADINELLAQTNRFKAMFEAYDWSKQLR